MKLAVIESIEATGNVALFEIAQVAKELQQITKQRHPYFGESHYAKETGHIQAEMDDVEHFVESIQLTEAQKEKAFILVEKVFADFTEAMNEMLEFAKKHPYNKPFTTTDKIEPLLRNVGFENGALRLSQGTEGVFRTTSHQKVT